MGHDFDCFLVPLGCRLPVLCLHEAETKVLAAETEGIAGREGEAPGLLQQRPCAELEPKTVPHSSIGRHEAEEPAPKGNHRISAQSGQIQRRRFLINLQSLPKAPDFRLLLLELIGDVGLRR